MSHPFEGMLACLSMCGMGVLERHPRLKAFFAESMSGWAPFWLEWLDRGMAHRAFTNGPGRHIESLPYRKADVDTDDIDIHGLIYAVQLRLKTPLPEPV